MPDVETQEQEPEVKFVDHSEDDGIVGNYDRHADNNEYADNQPTEATPAEPLATETELPAEEAAPAEEPIPAEPIAPAPVVAPAPAPAEQPKAIDPFEALGISKEQQVLAKAAIDAIKAGDFDNFSRIKSTDWDKVPDMDIVRHKLEQQYKDLDQEERDFMVASEMAKYDTGSFEEADAKRARILLKLEAKEIRDGLKAEQAQYKIPERQPDPTEAAAQQQAQKQAEEFEKAVLADPVLTAFETKPVVKLGTGENAFNYSAKDFDLKQAVIKGVNVITYDEHGKPSKFDMPKFLKAALFAQYGDDIADRLIKHGITLGKRMADAELRNPGSRQVSAAGEDAGEDMIVGAYNRR